MQHRPQHHIQDKIYTCVGLKSSMNPQPQVLQVTSVRFTLQWRQHQVLQQWLTCQHPEGPAL
jgi:hypothetical protein